MPSKGKPIKKGQALKDIILMDVNKVSPYKENAKKHPKPQIQKIANSIREFGFNQPIVVDKNNTVIVGHGRLEAAKLLGMKEVPVLVVELTEEQAKAYRLADNKLNESDWDMELVISELKDLDIKGFDIELTGFDVGLVTTEEERDDVIPEPPQTPTTKVGDIYQLGEHRIMCGDSLKPGDVEMLMNGKKADLGFNDPPYGMKKEKEGVKNDNLNYEDLLVFNKEWIPLQFKHLKENGSFYCWGIDEPLMDIYSEIIKPMIRDQRATFRNLITWDKGSGQGQLSKKQRMYVTADEKCLFVMCGVQGFNNNSDNYYEGWEPIREYLNGEMEKCGGKKKWKEALGNEMGNHYFTKSQWTLPTEENYKKLQEYAKKQSIDAFRRPYSSMKKEQLGLKEAYEATKAYFDNTHDNQNNVWHFPRDTERYGGHATPKPVDLCKRAIKSSCPQQGLTVDFFLGSGSTLIACEATNRVCYGMELDPAYIDVVVKRWEEYTEKKAVKLN